MKFLMIIVSEEYQIRVADIFAKYECSATMIASTGDFLEYGETIFLLAIEEHKIAIILKEIEDELGIIYEEKGKAMSSKESGNHRRMLAYAMNIHQFIKVSGGNSKNDRSEETSTAFSIEGSKE